MKARRIEITTFEKRLKGIRVKNRTAGIRILCFRGLIILSRSLGRVCEFTAAFLLFLLFATPLLFFCVIRKITNGRPVFIRKEIYWQNGKVRTIRVFNFDHRVLRNTFLFFHVLTCDLRLIGVSIKEYGKDARTAGDNFIYSDRPGIFSLWFLRNSSRTGHEGRMQVEMEYTFRHGFLSDVLILLRTLPAAVFHNPKAELPAEVTIMGVTFRNITMQEVIDLFIKDIVAGSRKKVFFVNPDCFNKTVKNKYYYEILRRGDYVLPDGIGVLLACKFNGTPLRENVNGTDMLPFLCRVAVENSFSIYLLGARPGVAEAMGGRLKKTYPGLKICGSHHGFIDSSEERGIVINEINAAGPDILLVAMGAPAQEIWIDRFASELNAKVIIGVGGLFDFYSGNMQRAPRWMREIGLEWLFRLLQEPRRMFLRYILGNPLFLWRSWTSRRHK
ncbi:WecB/TagA/CpsF family glycosyltransferase [Lentisphaerota bacterium ZTH]|nr:WecB/TagA/CpsF family glycosyltransferase [Lentisphaerota bacterium]WET07392.1 WecB/TagA/CpsF family glycosyltransferase [Lentisphaerota bacterium ZTH]